LAFCKNTRKTRKTGVKMIESLINGKLLRDTELRTGNSSKYCNFLLSVAVGEPSPIVVSGIAFNEVAERIAKLKKGDALTVTGTLKPNLWQDKTSGETKHGLCVTVSDCLSVYDVKKRKAV
jgi:single-strand DNA-binding protein